MYFVKYGLHLAIAFSKGSPFPSMCIPSLKLFNLFSVPFLATSLFKKKSVRFLNSVNVLNSFASTPACEIPKTSPIFA